ncbi:hypothetical protein V8F06_002263 [Rhypophila decipiens]
MGRSLLYILTFFSYFTSICIIIERPGLGPLIFVRLKHHRPFKQHTISLGRCLSVLVGPSNFSIFLFFLIPRLIFFLIHLCHHLSSSSRDGEEVNKQAGRLLSRWTLCSSSSTTTTTNNSRVSIYLSISNSHSI